MQKNKDDKVGNNAENRKEKGRKDSEKEKSK